MVNESAHSSRTSKTASRISGESSAGLSAPVDTSIYLFFLTTNSIFHSLFVANVVVFVKTNLYTQFKNKIIDREKNFKIVSTGAARESHMSHDVKNISHDGIKFMHFYASTCTYVLYSTSTNSMLNVFDEYIVSVYVCLISQFITSCVDTARRFFVASLNSDQWHRRNSNYLFRETGAG